jgi:predicted transposase YbfD/YdcC
LPKKTLKGVVKSGNDYLVQVKGNQPKLYKAVQEIANSKAIVSKYESEEKLKGRTEKRIVEVFEFNDSIPKGWTALNRIVYVKKKVTKKDKESESKHWYISSLCLDSAEEFSKGIRGHWSIENRLHWVKDVIQNEDNAYIKKGNGVETLSLLKNIAINISREIGYDSIKEASIYFASNVKELCKYFRT